MRVGDQVVIIHGRYRWKSGRIIAQPENLFAHGVFRKERVQSQRWLVELGYGLRVEIREYELQIISSLPEGFQ